MNHLNKRGVFSGVWNFELTVAAVVFGLIVLAVVFALLRSKFSNRPPSRATGYPKTEIGYVAVVSALAISIIVVSLTSNDSSASSRPAVTVRVTAFQWCWRFQYVNPPVVVTATCVDGNTPALELPSGQVTKVILTSADVVHSMWIPYLDFKMQAIPGHTNSFEFTVPRPGAYPGRCAEFCGLYHYAMDFTLKAVPVATYQAWLRARAG